MNTNKRKNAASVRTHLAPVRDSGSLTWLEEMVVRMSHGLSEEGAHTLEFRGSLHADTRARLALMEADALEALGLATRDPEFPESAVEVPELEVDGDLKARIIAKLSGNGSD